MLDKAKILDIIDTQLNGTSNFLVDLKISTDNRISVFIDGDNGITIDDCIAVSRAVEKSLDREEEDFELNVSSAGLDLPLKMHRQYVKNIGRQIHVVKITEEILEGKLVDVAEEDIVIELNLRNNAKKKQAGQENEIRIPFEEIKESRIIITF